MGTKKRKRRRHQNNMLVLQLLVLVAIVLVVFEGKLIYTMFTHNASSSTAVVSDNVTPKEEKIDRIEVTDGTAPVTTVSVDGSNSVADTPLAGLSALTSKNHPTTTDAEEPVDDGRISEYIDSPAVVAKQETPVDDSFFANSVFIGDSRMMGFRNTSGITQGTFLTSVGLSTGAMSDQVIASPEGNISVYQGLSGRQYDKIYLMLGTNDLGYYPWENFKPEFSNIIQQFHKLQPGATIYVCSVIYLDEAKTVSVTSYNNNENVKKVNQYQLEVCEELDYCHYLNLNEIFSNGYGSLISEASSDGIHLYDDYCKQMLTYLKEHYIPETPSSVEEPAEAESETELTETENEI